MNRREFIRTATVAGLATSQTTEGVAAETASSETQRGPLRVASHYTIVERAPSNVDLGHGQPETYFMAMGLAQLPSGRLVIGTPRGRRTPESLSGGLEAALISASDDHGKTWRTLCELPYDSYEPVLFVHGGRLYQLITPNRPEADRRSYFPREGKHRIWVAASDDEGATWTEPVAVLSGPHPYTSGGQTAMVARNGRLYATISDRYQRLSALACDLAKGPLNPAAWRMTDLVEMPIPKELTAGTFTDGATMRRLEGNVVEVGDRLLVLARAVINRYSTANMAAVFDLSDEGDELKLSFRQLYPLPGGQCKFYIVQDEPSQLYWMASNLPTNSQDLIGLGESPEVKAKKISSNWSLREDRRLLTLWYSLDALNWIPAGWIAKADGWAQSFMYPVVVIDGDDLGIVLRTVRDSGNYHDADLATYHTVKNFRELPMSLRPTF